MPGIDDDSAESPRTGPVSPGIAAQTLSLSPASPSPKTRTSNHAGQTQRDEEAAENQSSHRHCHRLAGSIHPSFNRRRPSQDPASFHRRELLRTKMAWCATAGVH